MHNLELQSGLYLFRIHMQHSWLVKICPESLMEKGVKFVDDTFSLSFSISNKRHIALMLPNYFPYLVEIIYILVIEVQCSSTQIYLPMKY